MADDCTDVDVTIIDESDKAYRLCLQEGANRGAIDWFPKSQVSMTLRRPAGKISKANIPDWLLEKKGW